MSFLKYLGASVVLAYVSIAVAYSQPAIDATITVTNVFNAPTDIDVFELLIKRESLRWDRWANGTFRLELIGPDGKPMAIDDATYQIRYVPNSSTLPIAGYNQNVMTSYTPIVSIANNMINIEFLGPDTDADAYRIISLASSVRLGRFEFSSRDGSPISENISFHIAEPRYHANAFKLDHDSVTSNGSERYVWYSRHDNVEMVTAYQTEQTIRPCDSLEVYAFKGEYIGDLKTSFSFSAKCELGTKGYVIERALVRNRDTANLQFEPRNNLTYANNQNMVACSVCVGPREYTNLVDDVEYRRTLYAYRLRSVELLSGDITDHDTILVQVPNAIISNAYIRENPFRVSTSVSFNIDDRLKLTAGVYDVGGRLIGYLTDGSGQPIVDKEYPVGEAYTAYFNAPAVASQGLYDIVLIGVPINDKTIEDLSRVVIKAQLLR